MRERKLLSSLATWLGIRLIWKTWLPPHAAEPIRTIILVGSAPQLQSAKLILSIYLEGGVDSGALIDHLLDLNIDTLKFPRIAKAYRKRLEEIDSFILLSFNLNERKIPGVSNRILLAKAPKTKFKENTILL